MSFWQEIFGTVVLTYGPIALAVGLELLREKIQRLIKSKKQHINK